MNRDNKWLAWKIKHGLAPRGRPGPLKPTGIIAKVLYNAYFRFHEVTEPEESGAIKFTQQVGGTLGPSGRINGD